MCDCFLFIHIFRKKNVGFDFWFLSYSKLLFPVWYLLHYKLSKTLNGFSNSPCSIISTKFLRWGRMAHPMRIAICWTILIPVCLACHDFLLLHTAFKKGSREGIPKAEATTAKALAVVLRTYSSKLSMSGLIVEIMVAKPAAWKTKNNYIFFILKFYHLI